MRTSSEVPAELSSTGRVRVLSFVSRSRHGRPFSSVSPRSAALLAAVAAALGQKPFVEFLDAEEADALGREVGRNCACAVDEMLGRILSSGKPRNRLKSRWRGNQGRLGNWPSAGITI